MKQGRDEQLRKAVAALMKVKNEAVVYFTRRDLLGEAVDDIRIVWGLPEPRKILRRQSADGSWAGPAAKTPVYPANHSSLVASFKAFRTLIERYQFTRESVSVERASEYLFSFQTPQGDIRGFIGNQYATYYTGYLLALLIRAGYVDDPRVEKGIRWLLEMRQDDGGWSIPILTHRFDGKTMYRLTSSYADPVRPDRTRPFSHSWTDMVLRAFAVHPVYRRSEEALRAGWLLKSRFFRPDACSARKAAGYWTRFLFWWPNLLMALESLSLLGFTAEDPGIHKSLQWFCENQQEDGLWECWYGGKPVSRIQGYSLERAWISLRICRMLKQLLDQTVQNETARSSPAP